MTTPMSHPSTRPRSGSWTSPSSARQKTGRFLASLKTQRREDLVNSPSLMTLPSYHTERTHPPLPGSARSTPHPSLARCETVRDKPLPKTPKRKVRGFPKSNSMATLTRLFKKLGKPQHDKSHSRLDEPPSPTPRQQEHVHPTLQHRCSASPIRPETPPLSISEEYHSQTDPIFKHANSMRRSMSVDAPRPSMVSIPHASQLMQEQDGKEDAYDEDEEMSEDMDEDEENQQQAIEGSHRNDEHEPGTSPDQLMATADAHDSNIVVDRLSKRFSGGHFGSAGGLMLSTLPLEHPHDDQGGDHDYYDREEEGPGETVAASPTENHEHPAGLDELISAASLTPPTTEDGASSDTCSTAESYALRIWKEDSSVYKNMERVAEWIGDGSPLGSDILKHYMSFFDFTMHTLDDAFRTLCSKLHLKAEAQQIDRVLEEFARRFWTCNPESIYGSQDVVHAIAYSLLLLNTDLHVALNEHKKMTRSAFVRNTMNAIRAQLHDDNEMLLPGDPRRASTPMCATPDPSDLRRTPSTRSTCSSVHRENSILEPLHLEFGSKPWQHEIETMLKTMYSSIRTNQVLQPSVTAEEATLWRRNSRQQSLAIPDNKYRAFKRSMATMIKKAARESFIVSEGDTESDAGSPGPVLSPSTFSSASKSMRHQLWNQQQQRRRSVVSNISHGSHYTYANSSATHQPVAHLLHHTDMPISYTSAAPYYKEGMIVCKHLLESANQKAKHRDWKECFMVVDRGDVRMYKLDNNGLARRMTLRGSMMMSRESLPESQLDAQQSTFHPMTIGGNDWMASAKPVGEIDLRHTLSNALPSGYSRQRPHAAALQQPNGGVYLFEANSAEQVLEWVATFNYWAARESKEPLTGGIGSMEYGWSGLDSVEERSAELYPDILHDWQPPPPPEMSSTLEEEAQFQALHKHVKSLSDDLDKHKDLKDLMENRFSKAPELTRIRAMSNWESKSQYLLHEIIKYQNYCDAIEKSLALQDKAIRE